MKPLLLLLLSRVVLPAQAFVSLDLSGGWRLALDDRPAYAAPDFDDRAWRRGLAESQHAAQAAVPPGERGGPRLSGGTSAQARSIEESGMIDPGGRRQFQARILRSESNVEGRLAWGFGLGNHRGQRTLGLVVGIGRHDHHRPHAGLPLGTGEISTRSAPETAEAAKT